MIAKHLKIFYPYSHTANKKNGPFDCPHGTERRELANNGLDISAVSFDRAKTFRQSSLHMSLSLSPHVRWQFLCAANGQADLGIFRAELIMGLPRPRFHSFSCFQTNITIFTTNVCEKCPSNIWCWDSNAPSSEYESPPITTRLGILPKLLEELIFLLCPLV